MDNENKNIQTIPPAFDSEATSPPSPPLEPTEQNVTPCVADSLPAETAGEEQAEPPLVEQETYFMDAGEVAKLLNVKTCMAYKIIRDCNTELKAAGKLVIRGKVLKKYLLKKLEV